VTADQRAIAEFCARYRCVTVEALVRAEGFELELTTTAARSAITRMLAAKVLCVALRLPERTIYQLTPKAASALGVPASVARPLQAQGIRRRYGILAWCCLGDSHRKLLTPDEFAEFYPKLADAPGIDAGQQDYFRLLPENGPITLVQATLDNNAQRDSIVRKCRQILRRAYRTAAFRALLNDNLFRLVVLTASETKARELDEYIEDLPAADRELLAPVRAEPLPQLRHIPGG
jgi:hypothetical protein